MAKYRVTWWEKNWWETFVEANSKEEAIQKWDDWTEEVSDGAQEAEDSFIDRSEADAELVEFEEIQMDEPEFDSAGFTISDREPPEDEEPYAGIYHEDRGDN